MINSIYSLAATFFLLASVCFRIQLPSITPLRLFSSPSPLSCMLINNFILMQGDLLWRHCWMIFTWLDPACYVFCLRLQVVACFLYRHSNFSYRMQSPNSLFLRISLFIYFFAKTYLIFTAAVVDSHVKHLFCFKF